MNNWFHVFAPIFKIMRRVSVQRLKDQTRALDLDERVANGKLDQYPNLQFANKEYLLPPEKKDGHPLPQYSYYEQQE